MTEIVSTIIPVYNRADFTRVAVNSVLAQTYRPIEIIIVDDGSTDDTPTALRELAAQQPETIRIVSQPNGGPGVAREAGRNAATGEFIQYLDCDDQLLPDKFSLQVQALRNNPNCDIAYGKTRLVNEHGEILRAPYKLTGQAIEYLFPKLLVDRWWNTHTPLYRKTACDRVGPWPTARMSEDWQYDARFGGLKTKLVYCDEFVSHHVQHSLDRLTSGKLTREKLTDIGDLIPVLYENAMLAEVAIGSPEMQHFSRWAFSLARQLAAMGEARRAANCFKIAIQTDRDQGRRIDFKIFRALERILGWRIAGGTIAFAEKMTGRRPSGETLKQAWE